MNLEKIIDLLLEEPKVLELVKDAKATANRFELSKADWNDYLPTLFVKALSLSYDAKRELFTQIWQELEHNSQKGGKSECMSKN